MAVRNGGDTAKSMLPEIGQTCQAHVCACWEKQNTIEKRKKKNIVKSSITFGHTRYTTAVVGAPLSPNHPHPVTVAAYCWPTAVSSNSCGVDPGYDRDRSHLETAPSTTLPPHGPPLGWMTSHSMAETQRCVAGPYGYIALLSPALTFRRG